MYSLGAQSTATKMNKKLMCLQIETYLLYSIERLD